MTLEMTYSPKRGGSVVRHFDPRLDSPDAVERLIFRRFRAREDATLRLDGETVGGTARLDRWTWWLDYVAVGEFFASEVPYA